MTTYRALICTDKPTADGYMLSKEALAALKDQIAGLPITFNFNPALILGTVEKTQITKNGLEIVAEMDFEIPVKAFIVPEGEIRKYHMENGIKVIEDFKSFGVALTSIPADPSITPISKKEMPSDVYKCSFCGGYTTNDKRGHCSVCGGPRTDKYIDDLMRGAQ